MVNIILNTLIYSKQLLKIGVNFGGRKPGGIPRAQHSIAGSGKRGASRPRRARNGA
jgi:hypothetical protein